VQQVAVEPPARLELVHLAASHGPCQTHYHGLPHSSRVADARLRCRRAPAPRRCAQTGALCSSAQARRRAAPAAARSRLPWRPPRASGRSRRARCVVRSGVRMSSSLEHWLTRCHVWRRPVSTQSPSPSLALPPAALPPAAACTCQWLASRPSLPLSPLPPSQPLSSAAATPAAAVRRRRLLLRRRRRCEARRLVARSPSQTLSLAAALPLRLAWRAAPPVPRSPPDRVGQAA
jgi:hypothetical protein